MTKGKQVVVAVPFNARQHSLLQALDSMYGEDVAERVHAIVVLFLHDNVPNLSGVGDD